MKATLRLENKRRVLSRMQASGICPEGCHMVSGSNRGFPFLDWKP